MTTPKYTFRHITHRRDVISQSTIIDVKMKLNHKYAYSPVVDVTFVEADGEEDSRVCVPFDLSRTVKQDKMQPWTSMNFQFNKDLNVLLVTLSYQLTPTGSTQDAMFVVPCFHDDFTKCIDRIRAYDGPMKHNGMACYCVASASMALVQPVCTWKPLNAYYGTFQCREEYAGTRNDTYVQHFDMLLYDRIEKLERVKIDVKGKLGPNTLCVLASDVAYVDVEFQTMYVLVRKETRDLRVVRLTYAFGHPEKDMHFYGRVGTPIKLEWTIRPQMCSSLSMVVVGACRRTLRKFGHVIKARDLLSQADYSILPPLHNPQEWIFAHPCVRNPFTVTYLSPIKPRLSSNDDFRIANMKVITRRKFPSKAELRERFELHFEFLYKYTRWVSTRKLPDDFHRLRAEFWWSFMEYGPFDRWDLSELSDLEGVFKDYQFPFHVDVLRLSSWKFPRTVQSLAHMFENVRNVSEIVFPHIIDFSDETPSMESMFASSSIRHLRMCVKLAPPSSSSTCLFPVFNNMVGNCELLETLKIIVNVHREHDAKPLIFRVYNLTKACPVLGDDTDDDSCRMYVNTNGPCVIETNDEDYVRFISVLRRQGGGRKVDEKKPVEAGQQAILESCPGAQEKLEEYWRDPSPVVVGSRRFWEVE